MSEDVYHYAQIWVGARAEGQTIEMLIDLPGYGWEELIEVDFGLTVTFATIKRTATGLIEEVAFGAEHLKALRRSPVDVE